MAIELGAAYISILPSTDKLAPAIRRELGSVQGAAAKQGEQNGRSFAGGFKRSFARYALSRGLFAGAAGASLLGGAGIKTAAELEQSKIGFETMLGSAKKAESFLDQIKKTAAATPFELEGLTQSSQKLLAFGFNVKKVIPTLTTLGDAASGLGVGQDGLDRIILAVGQIQAKGKVQSDELLQLTENGIPALKILANGFHKSTGEMQAMVTKGVVPASKAIPLLLDGIKNGTKGAAGETAKFGGLMEKQSTSLAGLWSTLHDTVLVGLANALDPLIPTIKDGLTLGINKLAPAMASAGKETAQFIQEMKDGTGNGGKFADVIKTIYSTGKGLVDTFHSLPGPVKKFGIEALIAYYAVTKLRTGVTTAGESFGGFITKMKTAETRSLALKSGLAQAAGVGGMLLIAQGSGKASTALGGLELAAGGALSGAALGAFAGPPGIAVGAGIGAIAGALLHKRSAADAAKRADQRAVPPLHDYIDTLKVGTTALTGYTRQLVVKNLTEGHAIEAGRKLGLSSQTVVNAALGNAKAQAKVDRAIASANKAYAKGSVTIDAFGNATYSVSQKTGDAYQAAVDLGDQLGRNQKVLKADIVKVNEAALAAGKYAKVLPHIPKVVQTKIDQLGLPKAEAGIAGLTAKYHLTPKQVETILKATGEVPTKARIQQVINKAAEFDKMRPKPVLDVDTHAASIKLAALNKALDGFVGKSANVSPNLFPTLPDKNHRRAGGGSVLSNQSYLVGEAGPELFTPRTNGHITPNHSLRSTSGQVAAHTPTRSSRGELTITNWHTGQGYFRDIAADTYDSDDSFSGMVGRMG